MGTQPRSVAVDRIFVVTNAPSLHNKINMLYDRAGMASQDVIVNTKT